MNDELNTTNNVNQPVGAQPAAQPAANEVLTPEAQQPMEDPIEAPVEPEVETPAESGTFTPPVAGMVPTGWAFPQDLASSLAMTTEDPEVASTGVDEVNQPVDDMDAGGPSDSLDELPESTKNKKKWSSLRGLLESEGHPMKDPWGLINKESENLQEEFDFEEMDKDNLEGDFEGDFEEEGPAGTEDAEDHDEFEEPESDCESCEDLEENPEVIPDLLDTIADILRKKDFDGSDEFEDEDEFESEDLPEEDLEMDEAVKYPAGSKPEQPVEAETAQGQPKTPVSYEDDIIRQYEKRALARKALIEKLKKPLWEKELDEIADTDERDKEVGYKSIDDAIEEGSLGEKFDRALKNPFEESYKGSSGWATHNNLGRLSEKRLNFRKMVGKGFLD